MPGKTLPLHEIESAPEYLSLSDNQKITVLNNWRDEVMGDNPDFKRPQRAKINDAIDGRVRDLMGENRLESILGAIKRGFQGAVQSRDLVQALGGDQAPENMAQLSGAIEAQREYQPSPEYQRFQEAESRGESPVAVLTEDFGNFFQIVAELTAESMGAFVPATIAVGGATTAVGAGVGALAGAGVGALFGGAGAGVGAKAGSRIGARAGFNTGVGLASGTLEFTGTFIDVLESEGVKVTDPESLTEAFQDEALIARAREKGLRKGIPVAVFDGVSAGLAGKLIGAAKKAGGNVTLATIVETLGQGAMGAGGEAAGSIVAGDPVSKTAMLSEFVGDVFGSGPVEIAGGVAFDRSRARGEAGEATGTQDGQQGEPDVAPSDAPPAAPPPLPRLRLPSAEEILGMTDDQIFELAARNRIDFVDGAPVEDATPEQVESLREILPRVAGANLVREGQTGSVTIGDTTVSLETREAQPVAPEEPDTSIFTETEQDRAREEATEARTAETLSRSLPPEIVQRLTPEEQETLLNSPIALAELAGNQERQAEISQREVPAQVDPPTQTRIVRTVPRIEPTVTSEAQTETTTPETVTSPPDTESVPDQPEGVRLSREQGPPLVDETGRVDPVSRPIDQTPTERVEQQLQADGKPVTPRVNSLEDIAEQQRQAAQEGSVLNPFSPPSNPSEPNVQELTENLKRARNPIRKAARALSDSLKFGKNRGGRSAAVNEAIVAGRTGREALNLILAHHKRRGSKELRRLYKAHGTEKVRDDLNRAFEPGAGYNFDQFVQDYKLEESSSLRQVGERMLGLREHQESLVNSPALPEGVRLAIDETGYMGADGAPYQKTAYLRWILDERDFLKVVREEDIILAKEEIRASLNRTLDNMNTQLQRLLPGETIPNGLDNRIRKYQRMISNYDNVYSSLEVVKNMDAIDNQVNDMFNYIMSPETRKKSIEPGNGLPLPHMMHKHLEGAFKVLYQELDDPFLKSLLTIDAVESLAMQNGMLEVILENDVSGMRNEELGHTVQLEGRKFGTLDGQWTTPAVARAFNKPFETNRVGQFYMNVLGIERLAALLQVPTVMRNFFSSYLGFAMAAGDFYRQDFWNAAKLGGPIDKLMRGLKKKNNDPAAVAEYEQLIKEGILAPGSDTIVADMAAWATTSLTEKTKNKFSSVIRKAGGAYAAIDYPAKLQALYGRIERETKAIKKKNGGRDLTAAEQRKVRSNAVEHVKKHYQYRYATPEIAATLSRLPLTDFVGYRFDAARIKWNGAINAVKEFRGENPEGRSDMRPLVGLMASSALAIGAFEGMRRALTPALASLFGDEVDDQDIMTDQQLNDLRLILPSYWREGTLNAYYDEDGKIIMGYVNTYNPWPEEALIAGAIQHGVEEGSTSVLLGSLASQYRETLGFNMFFQTMADVFFDADLNDLRAGDFEGSLTYQLLSSLQNGELEPDLFPKAKHEALGFLEDVTPPFTTKTLVDLVRFKQQEAVSGLPENVRGEIMIRTPEEILKTNVSPLRWHTIDIPRAFAFGGNKRWQRVSTARSDLGSVINRAVKNKQTTFTKKQLDDANRSLKKMKDRSNDLADFLNAVRNVNRQLTDEEMRATATNADLGGRISKTFYDEGVHAFITSYLDGKGVVYNVQNGEYFIERLLSPGEIKAREQARSRARSRTRSRSIRRGRVE